MSIARSVSMVLVPVSLCGQGVSSAAATLREFRIDAGHSTVEFSVPFLGHAVRGRFDDVQVTIVYAPAPNGGVGASAVSVAIATASVNSGSRHRDEHLRSDDFLDAAKYPVILFQSTGFALRDSAIMMRGTLTMHGVTRTVMIPFRASGAPIDDPHGSTLVHFTGGLRVARRDYGILGGSRHNDWFDALRSATMGDSVDITLEAAGWRTDFARARQYDGPIAKIAREGTGFVEKQMRAAIALNPASLPGIEWELDQLGAALLQRSRVRDAIALLTLSVELFPRSAPARASLGRAYEVAGSLTEARTLAREALAMDPNLTRALELRRRVDR